MTLYWIVMYLVVFAVVFEVLGWAFDRRGFSGANTETVRILLAFGWIFWLYGVFLGIGFYCVFKMAQFAWFIIKLVWNYRFGDNKETVTS